jgi:SagB-type dehydrogenase family enzyme
MISVAPRYYRRSRWLAARWEGERLTVSNYLTGGTALLSADDAVLLSAMAFWRDVRDLARLLPDSDEATLGERLRELHRCQLVEAAGELPDPREPPLESWETWDPIASQFHLATRDVRYTSREHADEILERRQARVPPPAALKHTAGDRVHLPAFTRGGAFPEVLLARRSWRCFGARPLTLAELSDLAGLSFAIQSWAQVNGQLVPLKTSPSGGACHSIELYWAVRNVEHVEPGLYHYGADNHVLTRVCGSWSWERTQTYFPGQPWFSGASAIALMTSVFGRMQWKYRHPRAYRVILIEAGHLCQTFCLTATWMGLAPFCSAALADAEIERDLGIDGISEAVLYAAGVAPRPDGVEWAPYPDSTERPAIVPPTHHGREGSTEQA